jgi:HD-GYP domain-containing protein (c-di-GMP phosphodiesterase class II)
MQTPTPGENRLAEILAALSLATDLANGNLPETALRACVLSVRLARELGASNSLQREVYEASLLRYLGCTSFAHEEASLFGDDIGLRHAYAAVDLGRWGKVLSTALERLRGEDSKGLAAAPKVALGARQIFARMATANCEVAVRLGADLGASRGAQAALAQLHERWDGKGQPRGLSREQLNPAARFLHVAHATVVHFLRDGVDGSLAMLRERGGGQLDPDLADALVQRRALLEEIGAAASVWDAALDAEPLPVRRVSPEELDKTAVAFARFVDLQSVFTLGHSAHVGALALAAGASAGLDAPEQRRLHRAGLVHDLGRVCIPTGTWERRGPLTASEWERVRLHPYQTERILLRCSAFQDIAAIAGAHHERSDGSGYYRGATPALGTSARILAAVDVYQALREERPHRPARSEDEAASLLESEAKAGRLDASAVEAVLSARGRAPVAKKAWPKELTEREVEVLRELARGKSNKAIAESLSISPRTAQHHVIHIYGKIGSSSRAAAALFAMDHGLL